MGGGEEGGEGSRKGEAGSCVEAVARAVVVEL